MLHALGAASALCSSRGARVLGCAGVLETPQDDADQQPMRLPQVCGTTPCMLQGARKIYAAIKERLGIDYGETTPVGDDWLLQSSLPMASRQSAADSVVWLCHCDTCCIKLVQAAWN